MEDNKQNMTTEIDLMETAVYIVQDGQLTKVTPKSFGQDILIWQNGKVFDIERIDRMRLIGQDVI
ncbi:MULTISPECIES: DUF3954 domain-containing protein [Heyndrickxia]|uniref:DUF3954 domain-containing protein n=1 Tax=Heyndrickxia coagulans DSM 1 = ATCC 7050 TaxID=1121088 RepID=A0A0B5WNK5_HEYCO|nr:DUF3954 domain-containing protein [Heyndrickxia coagulans]AJH77166.1 hypothetical protein BF29_2512 [Heyndrickxia coagulans DSM 1 = ATCC 7050]AJH77510.1 hypothetical protein BF29_2588 [Heyndrickxia coagulans DSM 1 = ATCC 7050]MED4492952.1 DUF3954 domain-containing protein [Heyndrickxia coagulans]MED4535159.1 DUF3954 domain-containing protein [Heyndrickxia coagulans]MED4963000.1 DUF3954 domain-containing protein [Heyndrickxia coagulans]